VLESLCWALRDPAWCVVQVGGANAQPHPSDYDPSNTTLFIGGLSSSVTEEDLRVLFGRYGDIVYTKIPPGKGCGFVQFVQRPAAEAAMGQMQVRLPGSAAPILAAQCCSGVLAAPVWSHT
jgi:RNA recognition motif-containing protein